MKIKELLREHEDIILRIKTRLYFLLEFEKQLDQITKGEKFKIKNDIIYRMIFDVWDMLVIDFASLAKGMLGAGGLFNQIKANLHEVKPLSRKKVSTPKGNIHFMGELPSEEELDAIKIELDKDFAEQMIKINRETLYKLFPKAKGRDPLKIRPEDIDDLKVEFEKMIGDVVDDRNKHRAHKFENVQDKASFKQLSFKILKNKFDEVEDLMNSIRLVVSDSTFGYSDMNFANKSEVANDLVTMILWGSNKMIDMNSEINEVMNKGNKDILDQTYGYLLRKKMIQDSHAFHTRIIRGDLRPKDAKEDEGKDFCFNDVSLMRMRQKGL